MRVGEVLVVVSTVYLVDFYVTNKQMYSKKTRNIFHINIAVLRFNILLSSASFILINQLFK